MFQFVTHFAKWMEEKWLQVFDWVFASVFCTQSAGIMHTTTQEETLNYS